MPYCIINMTHTTESRLHQRKMTNFECSKIHNKATTPTADNAMLLLLRTPLRTTVNYCAI